MPSWRAVIGRGREAYPLAVTSVPGEKLHRGFDFQLRTELKSARIISLANSFFSKQLRSR